MTDLEQVSERILDAARAQDILALAHALKDREKLLRAGAEITYRAWELGERACEELVALKQKLALEASRLEQVRSGVAGALTAKRETLRDFRG